MDLVVADSSFYISELRAKRQPFIEMEQMDDCVEWAITGMVVLEVCRGLTIPSMRDEFLAPYSVMVNLPTTNRTWELAARLAYESINGLRTEAAQCLAKIRPETLGQAARISGVTPADIALLGIWIARGERTRSQENAVGFEQPSPCGESRSRNGGREHNLRCAPEHG